MRYSGRINHQAENGIRGKCSDAENPGAPVSVSIRWEDRTLRNIESNGGSFSYFLDRNVSALFPTGTFLDVVFPDGSKLDRDGSVSPIGSAEDGGDQLRRKLDSGFIFDKWGSLKQPFSAKTPGQRARYAKGMADFTDYFEGKFGRTLFPHYGSLLGYARSKTFIPHDDDTDMSFISTAPTVQKAVDEYFDVIEAIKGDGHSVWVVDGGQANATMKLPNHTGTDLFLTWIQPDGTLFTYFGVLGKLDEEMRFFKDQMEGVTLNIPICFESLLEMTYGPTWRVPDPSFRWTEPAALKNYLAAFRNAGEKRKAQLNGKIR